MAHPLSAEINALLDRANFAHLATLMPDGSPQVAPVWVGREAERILVGTGEASLKAKNTRRDPRVGLSVIAFDDPYSEAQIRGRWSSGGPTATSRAWTRSRGNIRASRSRGAIQRGE